MADDAIKLTNFGYLTKKQQENSVKIEQEEASSLFSDEIKTDVKAKDQSTCSDSPSIQADDNSSEIIDALNDVADSTDADNENNLALNEDYPTPAVASLTPETSMEDEDISMSAPDNSNQYINISSETIKNIPSTATIQTQDGEIKVSDYINSILSSTPSLTEQETKQYALNFLSQTLSQTKEVYQTQKESEGIISSGYNFLKELTGLGTSDKDIEKQIANQEEMINALNDAINGKGDLSFEEAWKKYTGVDYSKEKMDAYLETSAKYQAIMVGCQYDEDFMENFEKETGTSVNDVMKDFISSKQETFGKDFDLESTFEKYQQDQQTFTSKLSSAMSMAGLACTLVSFVCPPAGAVLLPLGRTLQLSGMFIDNGLDLIDKATDKDGLTLSEAKDLGIDTGAEALGFLMGRKIGGFTNGLNNTVKTALGAKGVNNIVSTVAGQVAETTTDAALSLGTDYAIAQATSVAKTGEFLDSSQYWSVDRFLGEGRNQLIAILSGVAQGKVSKYQQTMVETAKAQVLMGDVDSARESLKNSGLKLADGDFDEFVEGVKMEDTLVRRQTEEIKRAQEAENKKKNIEEKRRAIEEDNKIVEEITGYKPTKTYDDNGNLKDVPTGSAEESARFYKENGLTDNEKRIIQEERKGKIKAKFEAKARTKEETAAKAQAERMQDLYNSAIDAQSNPSAHTKEMQEYPEYRNEYGGYSAEESAKTFSNILDEVDMRIEAETQAKRMQDLYNSAIDAQSNPSAYTKEMQEHPEYRNKYGGYSAEESANILLDPKGVPQYRYQQGSMEDYYTEHPESKDTSPLSREEKIKGLLELYYTTGQFPEGEKLEQAMNQIWNREDDLTDIYKEVAKIDNWHEEIEAGKTPLAQALRKAELKEKFNK